MGLSHFQRAVCHLLAEHRIRNGESYFAGGATLNELIGAPRLSRDLDIFHDTEESLAASWQGDRATLERSGYSVRVFPRTPGVRRSRNRPGNRSGPAAVGPRQRLQVLSADHAPGVRADAASLRISRRPRCSRSSGASSRGTSSTRSAATATCSRSATWRGPRAARTPGFSPSAILAEAGRAGRYTEADLRGLDFSGTPPDAAGLRGRGGRGSTRPDRWWPCCPPSRPGAPCWTNQAGCSRGGLELLSEAVASGASSTTRGASAEHSRRRSDGGGRRRAQGHGVRDDGRFGITSSA